MGLLAYRLFSVFILHDLITILLFYFYFLVVLVTGGSGFIASHVVKQLLQAGYKVRATVRDVSNTKKVGPLKELCPSSENPLEIVEADLLKEETWAKYVWCDICLHVLCFIFPVTLIDVFFFKYCILRDYSCFKKFNMEAFSMYANELHYYYL